MIDSRDEIDRLFRDKLSHYEEDAPPFIWERIADKLDQKRHARMKRFYASLAASVALLISMAIGYYFGLYQQKQQWVGKMSSSERIDTDVSDKNDNPAVELSMTKNEKTIRVAVMNNITTKTENTSTKKLSLVQTYQSNSNTSVNTTTTNMRLVQDSLRCCLSSRQVFCQSVDPNINRIIYAQKTDVTFEEKSKVKIFDKVYMSFTFAPLYSYRVVNSIQSATLDKFEKPAMTFSAGTNVIFASRRLQLSMGLYYTQMALRIDNVVFRRNVPSWDDSYVLQVNQQSFPLLNSTGAIQPTTDELMMTNTDLVVAYQYPELTLGQNGVDNNKRDVSSDNVQTILGETTILTQKFNYLEIPLNFQYNFYQRRVVVGIQTGINANLLVSNSTYAEIEGQQSRIGKTEHLRTFNMTSTFGISVALPITQKLSFLVEPRFRYYLLSVNRNIAIDTHHYSYGIYTGIRIRY